MSCGYTKDLRLPTGRGLSEVALILDGPDAGQFAIVPDDDYYIDRTVMSREQAIALAIELVRVWWPRPAAPPPAGGSSEPEGGR